MREPPKVARWLVQHFGCSRHNLTVIGDLSERYGQGRSRLWYWRQVAAAIVGSLLNELESHRLLTVRAILTGWIAFLASREILNFTGNLLRALGIWSRYWRHEWIGMTILILQVVLFGILTGWLVARLHRRSSRAMVLTYTASFVSLQIVQLLPDLLRGRGVLSYMLMYAICFVGITPLAVLIGGGVLSADNNESGRAAVR